MSYFSVKKCLCVFCAFFSCALKTAGAKDPRGYYVRWQGRDDLNAQPLVLETSVLHVCNKIHQPRETPRNKTPCFGTPVEHLQQIYPLKNYFSDS